MGNCSDQSSVAVNAPQMAQMHNQQHAPLSSATPLSDGQEFDTIVIGGGMSGVSAAVELANSGQRVAVIEANGYLGGRLKTIPVNLQSEGVVQFDEGASWIHGSCSENPITKLSKSVQGLVTKQTDDDSMEVHDQNGDNAEQPSQEAFKVYQQLLEKAEQYERNVTLEKVFGSQMSNKYFSYNVANDVEFQTSGPVSKLSAKGLDDDQFEGTQELILSGYQRFVETLASKSKIEIYLGSRIRKVTWNEDHNEITCENGVTVYAKNVVISAPIGVLKAKGIQFSPNLPGWKSQAINSIGFGNVCKILLDFPDAEFLESESHYIGVVSQDVSKRGLGTYFLNLNALAGVPVLMTFGLGQNADQAEKMSEANLKAFLAKRINAFAKTQIGPNDFKLYRTTWRSNKNFLGTYAYGSTQTTPQHWQNMAKPVFDTNWYFCGEHTTSKYRGTVHGAYLSGVFAAKNILDEVKEEDWVYAQQQQEEKKSDQ